MSHPHERAIRIQFYATAPYPCSYLPERQARSQVAIPAELIDGGVYSQLVRAGFRRSGLFTYRPWCDRCQACVPVRLRADELQLDRSQRKVWNRLSKLRVQLVDLQYKESHYALYRRYQQSRHQGGGMDDDSREQYESFILKSQVNSLLAEFYDDETLVMVSLIDQLDDGLSSVYTFFEPDQPRASFGTFNVLWQARLAHQLGLPYVYLGYWIEACRKMVYKTRFQPLEGLIDGVWRDLPRNHAAG